MKKPDRCSVCDEPLDDSRPWQPPLLTPAGAGGGAHLDCLPQHPDEEEKDD